MFTETSEGFAPYYLAGIRQDLRQTTRSLGGGSTGRRHWAGHCRYRGGRCARALRPRPPSPSERHRPLDPFPGAERRERVCEPRPVGQRQLGVELEQGRKHEAAARRLPVRQRQPLGRQLEVAEQEQVEVERARAVAGGRGIIRALVQGG